MTEEETVKKTGPGNVRKYADNILPMVPFKILFLKNCQSKMYNFSGKNKEDNENGPEYYR